MPIQLCVCRDQNHSFQLACLGEHSQWLMQGREQASVLCILQSRSFSQDCAPVQVERSHSGGAASTSRASEAAAGSSWSWASLVADPFLLILQLWATAITANHESSHTPVQALKVGPSGLGPSGTSNLLALSIMRLTSSTAQCHMIDLCWAATRARQSACDPMLSTVVESVRAATVVGSSILKVIILHEYNGLAGCSAHIQIICKPYSSD